MMRSWKRISVMGGILVIAPAYGGGWLNFNNETAVRMPTPLNPPSLSTADEEEKDYAWGDVDNDGDIDLVVVRKQPFTSTGKRVNVLFMNEGTAEGHAIDGVLVDRTDAYATASDVGGDQGFNTPTNDRDVVLSDLNGDGWLDMVTATTLTDNQAKHLSHPRVYMNQGEDGGEWQGFKFENFRIPQMHATAGPRFCSVAAGDVTGNGRPDLYFGDYDSGGSQILDYNNRLLINDGNGVFTDESTSRLNSAMRESAFGAASVIADINADGFHDIVKQTSLNSPTHIAITYNNPGDEGFFNGYDPVYELSPYFVSVGDLNGDGRLDLVIVDDGTDRYMLNTGNGGDGQANWTSFTFPNSSGFGGNSLIRDLNNDGHNDVIITDVDVDIPGCSRRTFIYRNLGNTPNVSFQEQGQVIPNNMLTGVHDVAVFDINGDGFLDIVVGRCSSTEIWIQDPPVGLVFNYPSGLPGHLPPDSPTTFQVQVSAFGGGTPDPDTGTLGVSVDGGPFNETAMTHLGGNLYEGTLPAIACGERLQFYVSAEMAGGIEFTDPASAPASAYDAIATTGVEIALRDDIEGDVSGWTIQSSSLTSGEWEQAEPHFTLSGGEFAAPPNDATQGAENVMAFVTEDLGFDGGAVGEADIDGGPTYLISPTLDLEGTDGVISYARWFFSTATDGPSQADFLTVDISGNNGATWNSVPTHTTDGTGGVWETVQFLVSDFIVPTANMRVRFGAADQPNDSVAEAGIDNFQLERFLCGDDVCIGDIDDDGAVGFGDLVQMLSAWGPCVACPEDLDGDDVVGFGDLVLLLSVWGACP